VTETGWFKLESCSIPYKYHYQPVVVLSPSLLCLCVFFLDPTLCHSYNYNSGTGPCTTSVIWRHWHTLHQIFLIALGIEQMFTYKNHETQCSLYSVCLSLWFHFFFCSEHPSKLLLPLHVIIIILLYLQTHWLRLTYGHIW